MLCSEGFVVVLIVVEVIYSTSYSNVFQKPSIVQKEYDPTFSRNWNSVKWDFVPTNLKAVIHGSNFLVLLWF